MVHFVLRCTAVALFAVYLGWQVLWLSQGKLPDSLLLALTGLPAPTTGGTRSVLCMLEGRWWDSLRHNPLTIPIITLFVVSLSCSLRQFVQRQRVSLPNYLIPAWCVALGTAWLYKLCQHFLER